MEARTGDYRVARAQAQSELELQRLLGTSASDGKLFPASPAPPGTPGKEHSRIERAAQRDPVGDQIPTANTRKCSFSGVLELSEQRY
jgi:hypothetical protein